MSKRDKKKEGKLKVVPKWLSCESSCVHYTVPYFENLYLHSVLLMVCLEVLPHYLLANAKVSALNNCMPTYLTG